jgi:ribosomal protein L21
MQQHQMKMQEIQATMEAKIAEEQVKLQASLLTEKAQAQSSIMQTNAQVEGEILKDESSAKIDMLKEAHKTSKKIDEIRVSALATMAQQEHQSQKDKETANGKGVETKTGE